MAKADLPDWTTDWTRMKLSEPTGGRNRPPAAMALDTRGARREVPRTMLTLDLLRHGQASPAGAGGDRLRELSPAGLEAITALARRLAGEGWAPGRILASPYRRTLQTAVIVGRSAARAVPVEALPELEPERAPEDVLEALAARGVTGGHVLLVGHQPLLGLLLAHLVGTERGLAPGTLVRVECADGARRGGGRVMKVFAPGEAG